MKKLLLAILCLLLLSACGGLTAQQVTGVWENESGDRLYLNSDSTYEIKYARYTAGELVSENGKYEAFGKKIKFSRRDKYTYTDLGQVQFERLITAEKRSEAAELFEDKLIINEVTYIRQED